MGNLAFVGTYTEDILFGTGQVLKGKGKGIYILELMDQTGQLHFVHLMEGVRNPSYLAFHPTNKYLYCVNEFKQYKGMASGAVSAYALGDTMTKLTFLNTRPSYGTDPCHLTVDPSGRFLIVANFASGSVSTFPIKADGSLGNVSHVIQHEGSSIDPVRQSGPHAHAATLDIQGKFVYVPDLGLDGIKIYALDTLNGKLKDTRQKFVPTSPGAGPRQIVMHPNQKHAYLINELNSTVTVFGYAKETGGLKELQTLSTLPQNYEGNSSCAEIQIHPSGKFLFGSNRGHDSIVTYAIADTTGRLTRIGHTETKGKTPRNFVVANTGSFVLVANQDTDNITVFSFDQITGVLHFRSEYQVPTPVCVKFPGIV